GAGRGHARLAVVRLDVDRVGRAADLDAVLELRGRHDLLGDPGVGEAEPRQGPGHRVDPADRDFLAAGCARGAAGAGAGAGAASSTLDTRAARLEEAAAPHDGRASAGRAEQIPPGNSAGGRLAAGIVRLGSLV